MTQAIEQHLEELREITADVMEVEVEEVTDDGLFTEEHDADSLRAIELLARIEKKYKIDIPQEELPNMTTLRALYEVVAKYAGWTA
ncbi:MULTISPECIES: acyl carrier protein [unclassified Saccharothrix]|uniref:acyl carrier protein n=1 Tax=unclassified Saccharothrix TaxID=2593673 RepID=UPI00307FBF17